MNVDSGELVCRCVGSDASVDVSGLSLRDEIRSSRGVGEGMQAAGSVDSDASGLSFSPIGALGSAVDVITGADGSDGSELCHPSNCPPARVSLLTSLRDRASVASRLQGEQRAEGPGATRMRRGLQEAQKDGRRVSAGSRIWGRSSTKLVSGGDENQNAKPGFAVLNAQTRFSGEKVVKSSLVPSPSNREVSEIMGVSDQGQVSKLMMAQ